MKHPTQALRNTYVALFPIATEVPEATLGAVGFAELRGIITASRQADTMEPGAMERHTEASGHPGSLTGMLNYYRALRERPTPEQPGRIAPPTLLLWGKDDLFLEHHVATPRSRRAGRDAC